MEVVALSSVEKTWKRSVIEAMVAETVLTVGRVLPCLLFARGSLLNDTDVASPVMDKRFPLDDLHKMKLHAEENKDGSETEGDDNEDEERVDDQDDEDDDARDEDFTGEEGEDGDPEDDPKANGEGGSEDEDDDEDEDDEDADEDGEDEDEEEEEEEEEDEDEDVRQPPSKKRK